MAQSALDFVIYATAGGARLGSLGSQLRGAHIRTSAPGGMVDLTGTLDRQTRIAYADLMFSTELQAVDNLGVVWRGRSFEQANQLTATSESIDMTWFNTSVDDQVADTITVTAGTAIETAFAALLSAWCPLVTSTALTATGNTFAANTTYTDKHPGDLLNEYIKLGGGSNAVLNWGVWPDGPAAAYQTQLGPRPTTPTYQVDYRNFLGHVGYNGLYYANRQKVRYNGGANVATGTLAAATTAQGAPPVGVGFIRDGDIITANEITDATDAVNIANTALTLSIQQRIGSKGGSIAVPNAMRDMQGKIVPLWRVRAGSNLALNGFVPVNEPYEYSRNMLYLTATDYDVDNGILAMTFENSRDTLQGMVAKLNRLRPS